MSKFKIDGAKFETMDDLKESLWPLYQGKMSREEFEAYVSKNVQTVD